jgi:hypothetical protein
MPQTLIIVRPDNWRFNPLQCFLADPTVYLVIVVDLLCRVLHLPPRARLILSEFIYRLYERFGIFAGRRDRWPTPYDLVEDIRRSSNVNPAAKEALLNRLITWLLTLKPRQAAYRRGWNPVELARHYSIDWEMRGATEVQKQLLLGCLLATVFHQKVESGVTNTGLSLLVALDDAQKFVSAEAEGDTNDTPPIAELATVGRSPGIGLCASVQSLYGFSPRLLPNLGNKFFGRLGSGLDYSAAAGHMSLTADQVDYANHFLKPGWFVGQTSEGACREPFLFKVPPMPELPAVTDEEAAASCEPLLQLPVEPAKEFDQWEPFPSVEVQSPDRRAPLTTLNETELRYLEAVVIRPGQASSVYGRSVGVNGQKAAKIRSKLAAGGFVREHTVALGTRGRTSIVLEPLPPAFAALGQNPVIKEEA